MTFQESETIELKEIVVEDIKKEIIAFANSAGGTLYVGVADDGSIVGVDSPDTVTQQISNMVRDSIKPDRSSAASDVYKRQSAMTQRLWIGNKSSPLRFSAAQSGRTIWQKRDCGRRVYMCGKGLRLSPQRPQQSAG